MFDSRSDVGSQDVSDSPSTIPFYRAHRSNTPVRGESPVEGNLAVDFEAETAYAQRVCPEPERASYAASRTLRDFYEDCLAGKFEPLGRKAHRKPETAGKERQALRRFEKYAPRFANNPGTGPWAGPPLGWLAANGKYLDRVFARMQNPDDAELTPLASSTVASTKCHLMVILNHAARMHCIGNAPAVRPVDRESAPVRVLDPDEVSQLIRICSPFPKLLAAVVVALYAGPRCEDLFGLKKSSFTKDARGRRVVTFTAEKNDKLQGIPITEATWYFVSQAAALSETEYIFDGLHSDKCSDSGRGRAARRRNSLFRMLLDQIGLGGIPKPWHTLRKTCNERYESHKPGVGQFILGHKLSGVNARFYRQPTEMVYKAVHTLPIDPALVALLPAAQRDAQLTLGFEETR